ncbi:BamA/TamA family outer membrane protein [Fodinibius sp.]|uniref:BamA/TamA family outer membrane protein n=1 Tax=Fodinibius sp. TaxID=1872440 RepID=UPI002ACEA761|nr:BamA/TamA family outer membrane protein [Fodinibius sp.]MDZ7659019.1 BamA/TamA family outer membrane protein [Fodinibius sp.]
MNKQRWTTYFLLFFGSFILLSCGTSNPYYANPYSDPVPEDSLDKKEIDYSIYLIGDAGLPNLDGKDKTLATLANHLQQSDSRSTTVFLGDNIYQNGMPADTTGEKRKIAEQKITKSLQTLIDYPGKAFFLSGNHDWKVSKERVLAQETFIEQYPNIEAEYIPSNGCPGPVSINLSEDWLLIAIDSEWWINQSLKPNISEEGCKQQSREEVINVTKEIVNDNSHRNLLVTFHHPLYSSGSHGGYFPWNDHLFPLTNLKKWLYLPLPIIGSTYPIYRKLGLSRQDIRNDHYQQFKQQILEATENAENLFFANGHEHSLEFFEKENHFAIVSGSASKTSYARRGQGSEFTYTQHGFARLTSYKDGSIYVEFWVPEEGKQKGKLIYQRELTQAGSSDTSTDSADNVNVRENVSQKKVRVAAGPRYEAGKLKRFIWGDHYRDAWTTPIEVPTIDLNTKHGGLEVLNVGGGQQSISITVQDTAGQKYIMRSVQKDPSKALPKELRQTFANDILQDQISASHPYGDLIIPPMAEAAGIYHTSSELVFVTEESGLEFTDDSDGALVFFEEFANETWFNQTYSKQVEDVIDTDQLWQKLRNDNHNRINEKQLLKTRLFDMFLGDWDRHDGQWFWAEHKDSDNSVFQPIPIDRDNAFFKSDGLIPGITNRKWALRKFQHFDEGIRDIAGINLNAKDFDRWFLTELSKEEWLNIARNLQESLTNDIIKNAVQQWPDPIYESEWTDTVINKLQARKDKLTKFAERYYEILSDEVNVFGSDKDELFLVDRKENGQTEISVFNLNNEGEKESQIYSRLFLPGETEEIRLYGFGGDDRFEISGKNSKEITVRIIGGEGVDNIDDKSQGDGGKKLTKVYDTKSGSVINNNGQIENKTSEDPRINNFEKESYQYDYLGPLITGGYNTDDGIFLGGGVRIETHGFRKEPFATMHQIKAKHSLLTSAFSFDYKSIYTDAVGLYDFNVDLNVRAPNFKSNYFGLGNETQQQNDSKTFYRFRFDQVLFSTRLKKDISNVTSFQVGPGYKFYEASSYPGRFISSPAAGLEASDFKGHHYLSLNSAFNINATDNKVFPRYGIKVNAEADLNIGLNDRSETFGKLKSEASLYYTLDNFPTTFAVRAGASTNIGNYKFFHANTLGGNSLLGDPGNLRGFLRDRFAGRTSFFQNAEFRTRLFNFQSYLFPADVGILGFFDNGRVWINGETSNDWHQGYGGGIWINPFKKVVITTTYGVSNEDRLFSINLGFAF